MSRKSYRKTALAAVLLVGMAVTPRTGISAAFSPAGPGALPANWTSPERLHPVGSGPGLVVCEPVSVNADAATTDFGAGCGRWLHLTVSGQPALGQTPLWSSLERAQTEMGRTDLRLTLTQAKRLASILGITHAAVGTITGSATHCTLTYRLWAVPAGKAVGASLKANGTSAQVLAQLPQLAKRLAAQIGLPNAPLPAVVEAKPADMALLGRMPRYADTLPTPAETDRLQMLTVRLPLAGLFLVNTNKLLSKAQWDSDATALLTQQPDNPLIWAQIEKTAPFIVQTASVQLARNRREYPKNGLFSVTDAWAQRASRQSNLERRAAEQSVQDAPRNPDTWLTFGWTISQEASEYRLGRAAQGMSEQDWSYLNTLYAQWLYSVSKAAALDPQFGLAWNRVAEAATFAGESRLADQAFWKSNALHPNDPEYYSWGLQMYQEKWDGDSAKLDKVAQALAAGSYPDVATGLAAVKVLKRNEQVRDQFLAPRQALLTTLLARTRQAITQNPADVQAHYDLAIGLELAGQRQDALEEYKTIIRLNPSKVDAHLNLGTAYDKAGMTNEALAEYRQAATLGPDSALAHYDLGLELKSQSQFPEAETEMQTALKLNSTFPEAHYALGAILLGQHRDKEAIPEYQKAAQLSPFFFLAYEQLCYLLDAQGRYAESLAAGRHVIEISHRDNATLDTMADDCLHLHDWPHSIQMSQAALQIAPNDAIAHENLGEAYIGQGKTADARAEWNKVLTMDHGALAQAAREMLAKYP
jgi:tetratricopeptide (TPR) repeat protein